MDRVREEGSEREEERERAREGESGRGRGVYLERDSLEKDVENVRE